jgi:lysophospholipase L1-like esterase
VKQVATAKNVPLIDLHTRSIELCEQLGPDHTRRFNLTDKNGKTDTTHLSPETSGAFAILVAQDLAEVVPALARYLRQEPLPAAP